ncbi:MAG: EAL domain-containing protein [Bryobacterales bacterium]|nr:EAL domain-containing protein [Bryobacterales bacterium]
MASNEIVLGNRACGAPSEAHSGGANARRHNRLPQLARAIDRALKRNEFELFLQPQIDLHTFSIAGAEALLRWRHPRFGLMLPGEFLPTAAACGQLPQIGQWVLKTVSEHAETWRGWMGSGSRIAVNVAPAEILDARFIEKLLGTLRGSGNAGCGVDLELIEAAVPPGSRTAWDSIELLRGLGFGIALDDFGVGYSSLARLRELPFTKLKIDRSFVQHLSVSYRSRVIVRSMLDLAKSLQMTVNAEGVENPEQLQFLSENGCDEVQGYLVARPMPAARFESWAAGFRGRHTEDRCASETRVSNVLPFRKRHGASRR